jgi:transcriptional regulator with XRE-family HTH domain
MAELTRQQVAGFKKLYMTPKDSGAWRTLAEIAEGAGYSVPMMTRILKDAGVKITRGSRPSALNSREFRGKQRGRYSRAILTLPKLRQKRHDMGLSQSNIAELLGLHAHWISNLENNMLRPTPGRVQAYAHALSALDSKLDPSARAAAQHKCRCYVDTDRRKAESGRKARAGSWGEFLDNLSVKERSALKSAILYRANGRVAED